MCGFALLLLSLFCCWFCLAVHPQQAGDGCTEEAPGRYHRSTVQVAFLFCRPVQTKGPLSSHTRLPYQSLPQQQHRWRLRQHWRQQRRQQWQQRRRRQQWQQQRWQQQW